jgi:hypothetical protein
MGLGLFLERKCMKLSERIGKAIDVLFFGKLPTVEKVVIKTVEKERVVEKVIEKPKKVKVELPAHVQEAITAFRSAAKKAGKGANGVGGITIDNDGTPKFVNLKNLEEAEKMIEKIESGEVKVFGF